MHEDAEIKAQVERLEAAKRRPELVELLPRVAAAGFGVIPLDHGEGWLEVAVSPRTSEAALDLLGQLLERSIRVMPVREALVHVYLNRLYPRTQSINFHTFGAPDFLGDALAAKRLLTEKPHEPEPGRLRPDPRRLALLDYAYESEIESLDGDGERPSFDAGSTDIPYVLIESREALDAHGEPERRAILHRAEAPAKGVHLIARESYATAGGEHAHGWRVHDIRKLPFMIHPTELQIVGLASDGTLSLYVYDEVIQVKPGETPRFDVTYYFLSMGQRFRRRLWLTVHGLWTLPREHVAVSKEPLPWSPDHLRRWLGLELAERAAARGRREAR